MESLLNKGYKRIGHRAFLLKNNRKALFWKQKYKNRKKIDTKRKRS